MKTPNVIAIDGVVYRGSPDKRQKLNTSIKQG